MNTEVFEERSLTQAQGTVSCVSWYTYIYDRKLTQGHERGLAELDLQSSKCTS